VSAPDERALSAPAPLDAEHDLEPFKSGTPLLDEWLKRRARQNEAGGASRTYVLAEGRRVVGYYSLAAGSVLARTNETSILGVVGENPQVPAVEAKRIALDSSSYAMRAGLRSGACAAVSRARAISAPPPCRSLGPSPASCRGQQRP
jgi:hypothetical protein